jgi:Xaa-Pro dipeptidase
MMRTVLLGDMTTSMFKAQERMKLALHSVKDIMRPGLTVSDADNLARSIISENDIGASLITRSGYSIGIAFPPSWDEGYILSLKQGDTTVLREGMTFHLIPWMWGVDGDKTVGISDTVYITSDGCESFFALDPDFTVKREQGEKSRMADSPASIADARQAAKRDRGEGRGKPENVGKAAERAGDE